MRRPTTAFGATFLLWQALALPAQASVTGTPEPPIPGPPPQWWLSSGNDWYGVHRPGTPPGDDYRTAEATIGGCPGDHLAIVIDDSMLTDRDGGTRTDEVTGTAGWRSDLHSGTIDAWGAVLLGARFLGDADGQRIQDATHRLLDDSRFSLRQDPDRWSGVGSALLSVRQLVDGIGWDALAAGLATSRGEVECELALHADAEAQILGERLRLWCGGRWRGVAGPVPSPTVSAVIDHERGPRFDFGIAVAALALTESWDPVHRRSYGVISVFIDR